MESNARRHAFDALFAYEHAFNAKIPAKKLIWYVLRTKCPLMSKKLYFGSNSYLKRDILMINDSLSQKYNFQKTILTHKNK